MNKDKMIEVLKGIIIILCGALFYAFSKALPEWMAGMILVGAITLFNCIKMML